MTPELVDVFFNGRPTLNARLAKAIEYLKRLNQCAFANDLDRPLRDEIEVFIAEHSQSDRGAE